MVRYTGEGYLLKIAGIHNHTGCSLLMKVLREGGLLQVTVLYSIQSSRNLGSVAIFYLIDPNDPFPTANIVASAML